MTVDLNETWQPTPDAAALVVRVLGKADRTPIITSPDGTYPDDVLVAWAIVADTQGVDTFTAPEFEEYFNPKSTLGNVNTKYETAVKSLKATEDGSTYDALAQKFLDTYCYNSMFTILVDEFVSKERAFEFAQSQPGSAPTPSGAEGEDPRSQWLS